MSTSHLKTGQIGEREGAAYLKRLGYRILETNFKTPLGEIDCIVMDQKTIVFVEIKTRSGGSFGFPEEAVGRSKQKKIIQIAQMYLKHKRMTDKICTRFDVLAILIDQNHRFSFNHIQNAFEIESKENT